MSGQNVHGVIASYGEQPLIGSLALAVAITLPLYLLLHHVRRRTRITHETCVCIGQAAPRPVTVLADGRLCCEQADGASLTFRVDEVDQCVQRYGGRVVGIDAQTVVDATHYLSGAAVCFARAVSDTPKIAALLLAAGVAGAGSFTLGAPVTVTLVGAAMLIGGWLHARRVAETMSRRITDLNPGQGLTANLVTASLVLGASRLGLPVSTTQVSCSAIFAIGLANGQRHWATIAQIVATWLITLPMGLVLGAALMWLLGSH